jgi:hypothetical protein
VGEERVALELEGIKASCLKIIATFISFVILGKSNNIAKPLSCNLQNKSKANNENNAIIIS